MLRSKAFLYDAGMVDISLVRSLGSLVYRGFAQRLERLRRQMSAVPAQCRPPAPAQEVKPAWGAYPPGHFYSPLPDWSEGARHAGEVFKAAQPVVPGIDMREHEQLALGEELARYYTNQPFTPQKTSGRRYFFENGAYSYSDALVLHGMIRHVRPRRFIEVGSGWSSCVTLDTNDLFFDGAIACTFIEPFPAGLHSVLHPRDAEHVQIRPEPLQSVPLQVFQELEANDILFIDSTHVSRVGSDVNRLAFEVLPALTPGVYVHVHDMFYPFEYPPDWITGGRAWNEAYVLRAFLSFNTSFEVVFWNDYMARFHRAWLEAHMPLCLRNTGGSLWIRRTR